MNENIKLCLCGCSKVVKHPRAKYIRNHKQIPNFKSTNDLFDVECAYCHISIKVHRWRIDKFGKDNVFCCRNHEKLYRSVKSKITSLCEYCKRLITHNKCRKVYDHIFCSLSCSAKFRFAKEAVFVSCECCNKIYRIPSCIKHKNKHNYCSIKCRAKMIHGENNPSYRSGLGRKLEYSANWKSQRNDAIKRDNGKCRVCSKQPKKKRYIHVHHLIPAYKFNGNWEKANNLNNLVTLCYLCHKKVERGLIGVQLILAA